MISQTRKILNVTTFVNTAEVYSLFILAYQLTNAVEVYNKVYAFLDSVHIKLWIRMDHYFFMHSWTFLLLKSNSLQYLQRK